MFLSVTPFVSPEGLRFWIASLRCVFLTYDCKHGHGSLVGFIYFDFATSSVPILRFLLGFFFTAEACVFIFI